MTAEPPTAAQTPAPRARFTITVTPVNDAPTFTAGADQTVLEDTGAQTVAGWATAISPGPADESTQTVSFVAITNNPGLFTVQPAVSPDGTLTYTSAPHANGLATVTVRRSTTAAPPTAARTGAARTFTISITAVNDAPSLTQALTKRTTKTTAPNQPQAQQPPSLLGPRTSPRRTSASPSRSRQPGALQRPTRHRRRRDTHLHPRPERQRRRHASPSPPSTTAALPTAARTPASPSTLTVTRRPRQRRPDASARDQTSRLSLSSARRPSQASWVHEAVRIDNSDRADCADAESSAATSPNLVTFEQTGGFASIERGLVVRTSGVVVSDGLPVTAKRLSSTRSSRCARRFAGALGDTRAALRVRDADLGRLRLPDHVRREDVKIEQGAKLPARLARPFSLLRALGGITG